MVSRRARVKLINSGWEEAEERWRAGQPCVCQCCGYKWKAKGRKIPLYCPKPNGCGRVQWWRKRRSWGENKPERKIYRGQELALQARIRQIKKVKQQSLEGWARAEETVKERLEKLYEARERKAEELRKVGEGKLGGIGKRI